ncbi:hypothetical protein MNBD_ALPHA12-1755, partial [hydrothermal vent metagenome]
NIAAKLEVDLKDLTGEAEQRLISELEEAFGDPIFETLGPGVNEAHQLVAQLPQMARALHICFRSYLDASATANAISNRLKSDPLFSQLLHQMLSQITAVRSLAEILQDVAEINPEQRKSFYNSIFEESRALSEAANSLISQFDHEVRQNHSITPLRELNDLIIGEDNYFPVLEQAASDLLAKISGNRKQCENLPHLSEELLSCYLENRFGVKVDLNFDPSGNAEQSPAQFVLAKNGKTLRFRSSATISQRRFQLARHLASLSAKDVIKQLCCDPRLVSEQSRAKAFEAMISYFAGALLFPYDAFLADAENSLYDLDFLAQKYGASFEQVAHRLVTLKRPGARGIGFGFLRADPSGHLSKQFPLPGLLMPNAGHACPLWAIYTSFRTPGQVARQSVCFADKSRYLFIAKASAKRVGSFGAQPVLSSVMLACELIYADKTVYGRSLKLDDPALDIEVGPSCRLCVRRNCAHRHEEVAAASSTSF